jgi:hypothetical protein
MAGERLVGLIPVPVDVDAVVRLLTAFEEVWPGSTCGEATSLQVGPISDGIVYRVNVMPVFAPADTVSVAEAVEEWRRGRERGPRGVCAHD